MENTITIESNDIKFYKARTIWVGTFVGGPLTAGYFIAENFKKLKEPQKAKRTWSFTILATILIFTAVFLIPENVNIPNQLIPFIYTGIAYYLAKKLQGAQIQSQVESGAGYFGWWKIIAVSLISLFVHICALFIFILLIP